MPNLQYYTWKNPVRCDECGEIIFTHTYFYYQKTGVGANQKALLKYYCCHDCFNRLAPTEGFKYPMNKIIQKELSETEKAQFWQDMKTGEKFNKVQYQRVSLNPDAFSKMSAN